VVEIYKIGSLAHGGFSNIYSDLDVAVLLNCSEPPGRMSELITEAKTLDSEYARSLSIEG
jgi:predicted nucleotidyltransferase